MHEIYREYFLFNRLKDKKLIKTKNASYENNVAKLVLSDTSEHAEGSYTCRAVNDAGSAETNCKVTIQGKFMGNFLYNKFYWVSMVIVVLRIEKHGDFTLECKLH